MMKRQNVLKARTCYSTPMSSLYGEVRRGWGSCYVFFLSRQVYSKCVVNAFKKRETVPPPYSHESQSVKVNFFSKEVGKESFMVISKYIWIPLKTKLPMRTRYLHWVTQTTQACVWTATWSRSWSSSPEGSSYSTLSVNIRQHQQVSICSNSVYWNKQPSQDRNLAKAHEFYCHSQSPAKFTSMHHLNVVLDYTSKNERSTLLMVVVMQLPARLSPRAYP